MDTPSVTFRTHVHLSCDRCEGIGIGVSSTTPTNQYQLHSRKRPLHGGYNRKMLKSHIEHVGRTLQILWNRCFVCSPTRQQSRYLQDTPARHSATKPCGSRYFGCNDQRGMFYSVQRSRSAGGVAVRCSNRLGITTWTRMTTCIVLRSLDALTPHAFARRVIRLENLHAFI